MKVSQLVATIVLRAGIESFTPVSWAGIGKLFNLTQDQARHRVTAFKKKFNVVDSDGSVVGWARKFLAENAPDGEKLELTNCKYYPGEVVSNAEGQFIVYDVRDDTVGDAEPLYEVYCTDGETDEYFQTELIGDYTTDEKVSLTSNPVLNALASAEPDNTPAPQFIITPATLIVVRYGKPLTIDKSHKNFDKIHAALTNKQWGLVFDLIDMKTAVNKYTNGRVTVENGVVNFDGLKMHGKLADRLIDSMLDENMESLEALSNFMVKCDENPDARVLSRLFSFMTAKDIRIDKDGDFYAYKVVRDNYLDKHSGTMSNKPGLTVTMKRNQVNPIDSETCSTGLHVCSKSYISHFSGGGDRVVLCKVHPKDVVSVPTDYGDAKMRTCAYYVVKDVTENFTDSEKPGVAPKG